MRLARFRSPWRWFSAFLVLCIALVAASGSVEGGFAAYGLALPIAAALLGFSVRLLFTGVELYDSELVIRSAFRTRRYARSSVCEFRPVMLSSGALLLFDAWTVEARTTEDVVTANIIASYSMRDGPPRRIAEWAAQGNVWCVGTAKPE